MMAFWLKEMKKIWPDTDMQLEEGNKYFRSLFRKLGRFFDTTPELVVVSECGMCSHTDEALALYPFPLVCLAV